MAFSLIDVCTPFTLTVQGHDAVWVHTDEDLGQMTSSQEARLTCLEQLPHVGNRHTMTVKPF